MSSEFGYDRTMDLNIKASFIVLIGICLFRPVPGQNNQCSSNGVAYQVRPDADVKFSVILTLRPSTDGQTCGASISTEALQNLAVLEWTVNRLNEGNFVDGVTLGFDVYDDCGISRKSMMHGLAVADSPRLGTDGCTNGTACQIGILGTSSSDTAESLLYALHGSALPVLSPFATRPALTDYPDFYRTQLSDEVHIQAVAKILQSLDLTYVAMVTTDDAYGQYSGQRLKEVAKELGICVDVIQSVKTGKDIEEHKTKLREQRDRARNRKLRVVYLGRRAVARAMFQQLRFEPLTNVSWLLAQHPEDVDQDWSDTSDLDNGTLVIRRSRQNVTSVNNFVTSKWTNVVQGNPPADAVEKLMQEAGLSEAPRFEPTTAVPVIDSVFSMAEVLQRQRSLHCLLKGLCDKMRKNFMMINHSIDYTGYSENITVTEFSEANRKMGFQPSREVRTEGELSLFDLDIVDGDNLTQISSYNDGIVETVNVSHPAIPTSMCNNSCPVCIDDPDVPFAYVDGESLILGIVSVHEVDPANIFKCGQSRTSQKDVMIIENILHTVDIMKVETGIDFGVVIFDDCYSSARTELVLSQIFAGKSKLIKPGSDDIIDVTKIAAVVTTTGSTVTISLSMLMRELEVPVISSAASSPDLDDRVNFPYFLRTVPSDTEQARAMVSIITSKGWRYVSVLFAENNYGTKGKEAFLASAKSAEICVAESPEGITDSDTESVLKAVFNRLRNHKSDVVVYFGTLTLITEFLKATDEANDFIFIGSEDWGNNKHVLQNGGRAALGSITLNNEGSDLSKSSFKAYVQGLKPVESARNPWFVEYWEDIFQCDLKLSYNNRYTKPCSDDLKFSDTLVEEYLHDQRIVHSADTVTVVAKGLRVAKDEFCRLANTFPCPKYFQYIEDVVTYIRTQTIDRGGKEVNVFKADGNGNIGFQINNVQDVDSGTETSLAYVKVGTYDEGVLTMNPNDLVFYRAGIDGQCRSDKCGHCVFNATQKTSTVPTTTHAHPVDDAFTVPDYVVIGILGFLLLVMILISCCFFCYFKGRNKELETQLKKTTFELRTSERLHGGFSNASAGSLNFVNSPTSPSGETAHEFHAANTYFDKRTPNGGVVNNGFVASDMYIHAKHDREDENQNMSNSSSPRRDSSPGKSVPKRHHNHSRDSPVYRPTSQTSYGLSTHHSFKKPGESGVKIQPRTQLNVPPCRPELPPPRDSAHAQKMSELMNKNEQLPTAVPKEKGHGRRVRNNPKRTMSPPSVTRSLSGGSPPYKNTDFTDFSPSSTQFLYQPELATGNDVQLPDTGLINVAGSMEKISRV